MQNFEKQFNKCLSYNCALNLLITERGLGKTFTLTKYVINNWIKHKEKFLYIRRYDNELQELFDKDKDFFSAIKKANIFPDHNLLSKNRKFFCDNECFGFAKRLTEAQDLKGDSSWTDITTIFFDEFAIEPNKGRYYLKDEGMIMMNLIDSIARQRSNIRIFCLGNATNDIEYSPLFNFWHLYLPYKKQFKTFNDNSILVHYSDNKEFQEARAKTLVGKLAKGTNYEKYAIKNKIINKNKNFLAKKSPNSTFSFAFKYMNKIYGVWNNWSEGKMYISENYDPTFNTIFAITLEDHTPNTMLISSSKRMNLWKHLIENFKIGNVYFESQSIKHVFNEVMRLYI